MIQMHLAEKCGVVPDQFDIKLAPGSLRVEIIAKASTLYTKLAIVGAVMDDDFPYLKKTPCISSVGGTSWVKDRSAAAREGMTQ